LDTIVPKTFHVKTIGDQEYKELVKYFNKREIEN